MRKIWNKEEALNLWPVDKAIAFLYDNSKVSEQGCWEYQLSRTRDGYGQLSSLSLMAAYGIKGTHRLMIHLVTGHVFSGRHEQVLHSCDNRSCCNPAHLSVGTAKENIAEAVARGRIKKGERHARAVLTEDHVRLARKLHEEGMRPCDIYRNMGVSGPAIYKVLQYKTWQHVN